jgi:hypothetical protein
MAWSRFNLLVISGAFDYLIKIAIKVGGYDIHTVGEDMEIIVRMRRYMEELETNRSIKLPIFPIRSAGLKPLTITKHLHPRETDGLAVL